MNTGSENYIAKNPRPKGSRHFSEMGSLKDLAYEIKVLASRGYYQFSKLLNDTFVYQGKQFSYFYHRYSLTWRSERSVEVPLARNIVEHFKGKRILEIGNVLRYYGPVKHDILDLYEISEGVINVDAIDFRPDQRYDLIFSISTFEHMGFDEEVKEPNKPARVAKHLIDTCLSPGGTFFATFPVGQNPDLDVALRKDVFPNTEKHFLKRISNNNQWRESTMDEVTGSKYNGPYPFSEAIAVVTFKKQS